MKSKHSAGGVEHKRTQVVLTIENGQVVDSRHLRENEFIGSMNTFIWMLKKAGYVVQIPVTETIPE